MINQNYLQKLLCDIAKGLFNPSAEDVGVSIVCNVCDVVFPEKLCIKCLKFASFKRLTDPICESNNHQNYTITYAPPIFVPLAHESMNSSNINRYPITTRVNSNYIYGLIIKNVCSHCFQTISTLLY